MFQYLPRHMFGYIQSKLFPKYFLLGTILSAITTITYLIEHPFTEWNYIEKIQASCSMYQCWGWVLVLSEYTIN